MYNRLVDSCFTDNVRGETIMNELIEILEDIKDDVDFSECKTLIDDHILDSFDILSIISELNDAFDITIPASEIIPANFNSAEAMFALVTKLQNED